MTEPAGTGAKAQLICMWTSLDIPIHTFKASPTLICSKLSGRWWNLQQYQPPSTATDMQGM
jgi:hypothetical protein